MELPDLRSLTRAAATVRYDALSDCLETLFMYRPGSTGAASAALWQLEERVLTLHDLMLGWVPAHCIVCAEYQYFVCIMCGQVATRGLGQLRLLHRT